MNEDKKEINPLSSLHTLEGDLLASMKDENYGSNIVKIVTQGKNGKPGMVSREESAPINPKAKQYILGGVATLLGIGSILFYTLNLPTKEGEQAITSTTTPLSVTEEASTTQKIQSKSIFEADVVIPLAIADGNKNDLIQKIQEAESELLKNKVGDKINTSFLPDVNLEDLFNKLQYSGPESLLRAISKDQSYNFGTYHVKGNEFEKYLLFKIDIFDQGFSSMLAWENTLPIDFERIYTFGVNASTTSSSTLAISPKFTDKVVRNIDTRTFIDPKKGIRITYGFINRQYLLITSGEEAFGDILNKLLKNNILR